MSVPDGPLLTEREFDRLCDIVPDLKATQLWNIANLFDKRIVAREDEVEHRERMGFHAD